SYSKKCCKSCHKKGSSINDKKKLVVCMDLLSGCLLITVYIVSSYYGLNLFIIYTTTFLMTGFTTFFGIVPKISVIAKFKADPVI
ncbi:hypothetical protein ACT453_54000, partial [Bacillus sp. D-CC]